MIIFYEGLPRSGKSLNALKEYVVPMLKKNRHVYAYIEGLNHELIAKLAEIDYDKCIELLIPLKREDVLNWYKIVPNDSFIVLDEIQNFYPESRNSLDSDVMSAIAEHGHNGLDILLMGQVFSDVHKAWLGRCAQRVLFMKREAVGKPDEFTQIIYKPVVTATRIKWQELRRIKAIPYDKAYFGAYKSHTVDTENKDTLIDDRANVWNSPILTRWLPLFAIIVLVSLFYLIYMFTGGGLEKSLVKKPPPQPPKNVQEFQNEYKINQTTFTKTDFKPTSPAQPIPQALPQIPPKQLPNDTFDESDDQIQALNKLGRPRLSGFIKSRTKMIGFIEWRADDFKVIERMTFQQIKAIGYIVLLDSDNSVAIITNGINRQTITSWPVNDPAGEITQHRVELIQSQAPPFPPA